MHVSTFRNALRVQSQMTVPQASAVFPKGKSVSSPKERAEVLKALRIMHTALFERGEVTDCDLQLGYAYVNFGGSNTRLFPISYGNGMLTYANRTVSVLKVLARQQRIMGGVQ